MRDAPLAVGRETSSRSEVHPTPSVCEVGPIRSGAWLSPVERCVRVAEVPGSNPGAPISEWLEHLGWMDHPSRRESPTTGARIRRCRESGAVSGDEVARQNRRFVLRRQSAGEAIERVAAEVTLRRRRRGDVHPGAPISKWLEPSHNWYCTGLENRRPKGLVGSSPTGSV